MGSKYVLNYFPITARGEVARLLFHVAGVDFTDNQIPFSEWPQNKGDVKRFPLGQMPTLEVNDSVICQSSAIYCFLANEFNLYGSSNMDRASIDQIRETIRELHEGFVKIHRDKTKDEETKKADIQEFFGSDRTKQLMGFLVNQLKSTSGKYFLGDQICLADIVYFVCHEYVMMTYPAAAVEYPALDDHYKSVAEIERIKAYIPTRTHKPF